jgi:hypothetical protein
MTRQQWSRVGLRIDVVDGQLSKEQISAHLRQDSVDARSRNWFADFGQEESALEYRIEMAEEFVMLHQEQLTKLSSATEIGLDIAFTPRGPQDGLVLSPRLVAALSAVHASTRVDVYLDL